MRCQWHKVLQCKCRINVIVKQLVWRVFFFLFCIQLWSRPLQRHPIHFWKCDAQLQLKVNRKHQERHLLFTDLKYSRPSCLNWSRFWDFSCNDETQLRENTPPPPNICNTQATSDWQQLSTRTSSKCLSDSNVLKWGKSFQKINLRCCAMVSVVPPAGFGDRVCAIRSNVSHRFDL